MFKRVIYHDHKYSMMKRYYITMVSVTEVIGMHKIK